MFIVWFPITCRNCQQAMPRTGQPPQLSWIFQVVWAWSTRVWSRRMSMLAETLPLDRCTNLRSRLKRVRGPDFHNFQSAVCVPSNVGNYSMLIWHLYTVLVRKTGNPKPLRSRLWTQAVLMFNSLQYTFMKLYDSSPIGSMYVIFTYIDHKINQMWSWFRCHDS